MSQRVDKDETGVKTEHPLARQQYTPVEIHEFMENDDLDKLFEVYAISKGSTDYYSDGMFNVRKHIVQLLVKKHDFEQALQILYVLYFIVNCYYCFNVALHTQFIE